MFRRWLEDRSAGTAIEYALLAAMVAIGAVAGLTKMGTGTNGLWGVVGTAFNKALGS